MVRIDPGQTEIGDLDLSSTAHENIVWLQVTVNDGVSVEKVKSTKQLTHNILNKERG